MRVGSELKTARKKAGISLEVISKRTKIPLSKLTALEKNEVKSLPTGLYLFSAIRAYAREVRIDPEPIVERLRAEFGGTDALDALHALDATGALDAKTLATAGRSGKEQSNRLRNGAIAAGVLLIAAAASGAYLHNMNRLDLDVRVAAPPPPAVTVVSAIVPLQSADAVQRSAPAATQKPKRQAAAVVPEIEPAVGAVFEEPATATVP